VIGAKDLSNAKLHNPERFRERGGYAENGTRGSAQQAPGAESR
jgi:hypothetical protein